jgi:hypothetical protein
MLALSGEEGIKKLMAEYNAPRVVQSLSQIILSNQYFNFI